MSYLEGEGAEGDTDVGADVLVLVSEDGPIGYSEDVVRLAAALAAGDRGVVLHEPIGYVCIAVY